MRDRRLAQVYVCGCCREKSVKTCSICGAICSEYDTACKACIEWFALPAAPTQLSRNEAPLASPSAANNPSPQISDVDWNNLGTLVNHVRNNRLGVGDLIIAKDMCHKFWPSAVTQLPLSEAPPTASTVANTPSAPQQEPNDD